MRNLKLLSALFFIIFLSCNPNDESEISNNNPSNTDFAKNFGPSVSRDFIGQIVDESNDPIPDAAVKIGNTSIQTDVNGVFIINSAEVHEKFAYITVKKSGYIDGSRALVPTSGKNNIKIMLLSNAPTSTIQSGISATVALTSATKIIFDGAFQDENGAAYSGSVSVSEFHLMPSNANIGDLMPGMLYAQAADGKAKVLETFGMLHVELTGSGGQKLQIASGHTAQITMAIDASQMATAPASISLWHFDEANGYWKEEGSATKDGNKYVGNVSHFSWWNCDIPNSSVLLTFNIVNANGSPIPNLHIILSNLTGNHSSGWTDNNGQLKGLVPANEVLTVNIYSQMQCSALPINSMSIGQFTSDTVLPTIVLNSGIVLTTTVQGSLLKCDSTNVTNGYILLNYGNDNRFVPVTNGSFSINTVYCNSVTSFTLKGIDYDNQKSTNVVSFNYTTPLINVGNLITCSDISEFISYRVNSGPTVILTENMSGLVTTAPDTFEVFGQNMSTNNLLKITGYTIVPGAGSNISFFGTQSIAYNSPNHVLHYNLIQIGAIGDYIDVDFNCTFIGYMGDLTAHRTIIGFAHVKRQY